MRGSLLAEPKLKSFTPNTSKERVPAKSLAVKKFATSARFYRRNRVSVLMRTATRVMTVIETERVGRKKERRRTAGKASGRNVER